VTKNFLTALLVCFFCNLSYSAPLSKTSSHSEKDFVGASACQSCHQDEFKQWTMSDHYKAMTVATSKSVLGNFDNQTATFHKVKSNLYKDGDKFLVDTSDETGALKTFQIKYTFGFYPLQQYLIEMKNGHIQALNIAWDSRTKAEGGQRWFHLREDEQITPDHPFQWTNHFQNWNSRCADCHSTNLEKNYNAKDHSYQTTWSEINVACESCHGPGKQHIDLVNANNYSNTNSGFSTKASEQLQWQMEAEKNTAVAHGQKNNDNLNMCARCHSLRTPLTTNTYDQKFLDDNRLHLLDEAAYFSDGQIQEEVFVFGSFLQSKMYKKGVTCNNCHNSHTGKVRIQGNGLCSQCHKPEVFDSPQHHHHKNDDKGSQCVNCHMPNRTYMQVDDRRDHSFTIPRPDLSATLDVPNACTTCHDDKDNAWASEKFKEWGITPKPHWAQINHRASNGDVLVTRALVDAVDNAELNGIIKASLLQQLAAIPSRVSIETAQRNLQNDNPLVRRAAVTALQNLPAELRWKILSPFINDPSQSVRFQVAASLAGVANQLPSGQISFMQLSELTNLIKEYQRSLLLSEDSPATQLAIANLEMRQGNIKRAEQALDKALLIEPAYVPALLNQADIYREKGQAGNAEAALLKALQVAPDSAAAQYSYALLLVRKGDYQQALPYLKIASELPNAIPNYAYVYAIALEHEQHTDQAIEALKKANKRWPNQYDLLITLVLYLENTGQVTDAYKYISRLSYLAPNAPEVKQLINKYKK
jgi:predicted CXXCH cytochrome family protein